MKPRPDLSEPTDEEVVWQPGNCPFCDNPIGLFEETVRCPGCKTLYHAVCWRYNGGRCGRLGCDGIPTSR